MPARGAHGLSADTAPAMLRRRRPFLIQGARAARVSKGEQRYRCCPPFETRSFGPLLRVRWHCSGGRPLPLLPSLRRLRATIGRKKLEHHASRSRRRIGGPAFCPDKGPSPADLSQQTLHPRRAVPGRRAGGHFRQESRRAHVAAARPAGAGREQERRGGGHRHRLCGQGRQRCACHGADERLGRRHHAEPDAQDALRSGQGPGADRAGGARAGSHRGQRQDRHRRLQGADRQGQGRARQDHLRLGRHRRHHSSGARIVQARDRHATSCTCPIAAPRRPSTTCWPARCK